MIQENYNNSPEGNAMRALLDKMEENSEKFVVLTHEELKDLFAISSAASVVLEERIDRILASGKASILQRLHDRHLYTKEDALSKINEG